MNIHKAIVTSLIILNVIVFFVMRNIKYQKRMLIEEKEWYEKEYAQLEDYDETQVDFESEIEVVEVVADEDFEYVYEVFPEFEDMKRLLSKFKNNFEDRGYEFKDEIFLKGTPKELASIIKSKNVVDHIGAFVFYSTKAELITYSNDGFLAFDMPATEYNPEGYKVCYAPGGPGQIEEYLWNNSIDFFRVENLTKSHWYYIKIDDPMN